MDNIVEMLKEIQNLLDVILVEIEELKNAKSE